MRASLLLLMLAGLAGCAVVEGKPGAQTLSEVFAPPTPQEAARMALDLENPDNRFRGTMLLANAPWGGDPIYLEMYRDYVDDEVPNVRAAATRALGNHGGPEHVELILPNLDDPNELVRLEAAQALQRLHNPIAIPALIRHLDPDVEEDTDVRADCADALGQYAQAEVLQALISALDDRSLSVNHHALKSLRTLTGEDFGLNRAAWQRWFSQTDDPFRGQRQYTYPVFHRDKRWIEFIPFIPPPPNEEPRPPVGMPPVGSENR